MDVSDTFSVDLITKKNVRNGESPEDLLRRLAWTFLLSSDGLRREKGSLLNKRLFKSVAILFASLTGVAGSVALIYTLWRLMNNRGNKGTNERKSKRVCVVGAGIAGTTTAWALERSGFSVALHETKNYIGGNAKSHTWKVNRRDVTTGLSVLAWPGHKFHNYNELMRTLNVRSPWIDYSNNSSVQTYEFRYRLCVMI